MKQAKVVNEFYIPDDILNQIADMVVPVVFEKMCMQLDIWDKLMDLPPAPTKSQIKKVLGIGEDKLNFLIANGATPMLWGDGNKSTVRIERSDIRKAFENTKIKIS
ncbi:hypothetical protein [Enterococcus sp. AZ103]|uniref:hypothetical protein n=1 Tax=Enterococcus sp. AZ103 TaxID=2774628 RepID=UPI003F25E455